jgi:hypothetical protein
MKKVILKLATMLLMISSYCAQIPAYNWAFSVGSPSASTLGTISAVDASGNIYTAGVFNGTVDFDPGPGIAVLTPSVDDGYIAKYNSSGVYQWAFKLGGFSNDAVAGVAVDGLNNIYITGYFSSTIDFDPGPGTANLTPVGSEDIFLAKYTSAGAYVWAFKIGNPGGDFGRSVIVDNNNDVYLGGHSAGQSDFDPGPGTATLAPSNSLDMFLAKYNSSGAYQWAFMYTNSTGSDDLKDVVVDASNNVYVTGSLVATTDFDPGPGTNSLSAGIFVAKYNSSGNYQWGFSVPSAGTGAKLAVTGSNLYLTGTTQGTVDFDPGPGTANLISAGVTDIYISKFNTSGAYQWAFSLGSTTYDDGIGITVDAQGAVYACGMFQNTVDFDPGIAIATLTSNGARDIYLAKYSSSGAYQWAFSIGTAGNNEVPQCVLLDAGNNIIMPGRQIINMDFDPGPGVVIIPEAGGITDLFLAKYSCAALGNPGAINGPTAVCNGTSAINYSINVSGAGSYVWNLPGGWTGTSATNSIAATPGTSGIFTVNALNSCGASTAQTLSVSVNPLPVVTASTSTVQLCIGNSATLSAGGANTYSWNPGGIGSIIVISPTVNTTYTVTGTDNNACKNNTVITQAVINCSVAGIHAYSNSVVAASFFPNPTKNTITITGISFGEEIIVYNCFGQIVVKQYSDNINIVDLSMQINGIYFVRIGSFLGKVIKE